MVRQVCCELELSIRQTGAPTNMANINAYFTSLSCRFRILETVNLPSS
jgi:hypothetical protein